MTTATSKNFTRGGQIFLHSMRMLMQVTNIILMFAGISFLLITLLLSYKLTSSYERYILSEYTWANILPFFDPQVKTHLKMPYGNEITVRAIDFANTPWVKNEIQIISRKILTSLIIGLIVGALIFLLITRWLQIKGEAETKAKLLKGDKILDASETKKLIISENENSDINIAGVPLIKNSETVHLLFHGTAGTGKSTAIKEILDEIRKRGEPAIIYDKGCNFLEEFYKPDSDILLNSLDIRSRFWDLWRECRDAADFDSLAAALIPMPLSTQDPFWVNAARTIFSATAYKMRNDPDKSIAKLIKALLSSDLNSIQEYLKGTEAETLVSDKIEKTAISIKSVLATYLKSLRYVKEGKDAFSIRNWVTNDNENNWLFITSLADRHETLKPLISAWLDIAVNSILSLPADQNRRIWLILDELPSLHQLPYFTQLLAESRKFGGCVVVGIQNYAQLAKLYGQDGAREISSLINTRFMFRQPDPEMARWSASNMGETILEEQRESKSYGANTIRDGVSLNRQEARKPLISYSEIMSLANFYAYMRFPGKYPITLVNFIYKARKRINQNFIARDDLALITLEPESESDNNDAEVTNKNKETPSQTSSKKSKPQAKNSKENTEPQPQITTSHDI